MTGPNSIYVSNIRTTDNKKEKPLRVKNISNCVRICSSRSWAIFLYTIEVVGENMKSGLL